MIDIAASLFLLTQIFFVDLLLGADNAIVIAMACRRLPPEDTRRAVILGAGGAIALRLVMILFANALLGVPLVKLVGAWTLIVIALNVRKQNGADDDVSAREAGASDFLSAAAVIMLADAAMSLDNVVALAAIAGGNLWLLAIGVLLSIPDPRLRRLCSDRNPPPRAGDLRHRRGVPRLDRRRHGGDRSPGVGLDRRQRPGARGLCAGARRPVRPCRRKGRAAASSARLRDGAAATADFRQRVDRPPPAARFARSSRRTGEARRRAPAHRAASRRSLRPPPRLPRWTTPCPGSPRSSLQAASGPGWTEERLVVAGFVVLAFIAGLIIFIASFFDSLT